MKFSWYHLPTFYQEFHGSEAQFYQDMLEETDRAEALCFHAVWCAEHHFYDYGGHIPSVPVLCAAIAQRTKRLRIGSGIALAPLQDPIRLAEEFAMLDCLSGGRLDFGIGRGFQKVEYDAFERDMADSRVLFEEAHEIIMKAWAEEHFSHKGKFRSVKNLRVIPKPKQKLPPVYVAAIFTPQSFEWTGRMGYNMMVVPYAVAKPEILAGNLKLFHDRRRANDHHAAPDVLGVYHFLLRRDCGESKRRAAGADAPLLSGCGSSQPRSGVLRAVPGL
jgi:alkanesulfonate monooxygenase SsuD/methylene tetrahydromethanopterin reductase-like flavin-dependent oxidoreductase (luciferase family)